MRIIHKKHGILRKKHEMRGGELDEIGSSDDRVVKRPDVLKNTVLASTLPAGMFSSYQSLDRIAPKTFSNAVNGGQQPIILRGPDADVMDRFSTITFRNGRKKSDNVKLKL